MHYGKCEPQVMDMFARNEREKDEWRRCWPFDDKGMD